MHAREIPRTATPPLRRPDRPGSPAVPPKELRISTKRDVVASALTKDLALAGRPAALIAASLGPRSFSDVDAHAPPNKEFLRSVSAPETGARPGSRAEPHSAGSDPEEIHSRQLFIRNLPYSVSWQDLKDLMRESGGNILRADVSLDHEGKSKGFGSVVFESVDDARRAVEMFNGREFSGRILQVHQDRNARSEQTTSEGRQLFVTNLPYQMRWQDLKTLFRECGNVIRADVLLKSDGRSKGLGVVVFERREEALEAIERFNNFQIHGRTIQVREDKLGHLAFLNNTPHQYHHRSPNLEATPDSPDHRARTPNSAPRIPSASGMGYLPGHGMFPAQPVSFMRFPGALAMSPFMIPPDSPPYPDEPPEDDDELASPTMETVNAAIGSLSLGSQASSLPRDRPHLQPAADGPWQPYPPELSSALRLNSPVEPPPFQRRPSTGGRFRRPPPLSGNYMYSTAFSPPPMSPLSYPVGPFHFNPLSPIYTGPLDRRLSGGFLPSDFPIGPQGEFGVYYGTPGPAAAAGPPGLPGLVGRGPEEVPAAARNEAAVVEAEEKAVVEKEEAAESTQGTAGTEPLEKLMGGS